MVLAASGKAAKNLAMQRMAVCPKLDYFEAHKYALTSFLPGAIYTLPLVPSPPVRSMGW